MGPNSISLKLMKIIMCGGLKKVGQKKSLYNLLKIDQIKNNKRPNLDFWFFKH